MTNKVTLELSQTDAMILVQLLEDSDADRFSEWATEEDQPINEDYLDSLCTQLQEKTYGN